ncbi:MAG: hypothetical protein HS113_19920 [Verrucomicrobiales bacterium]|nr:hypothetical protein [Verrucomicrobiales bacterium]
MDAEPLLQELRKLCRERRLGLLNREEFESGLEELAWRVAPGCQIEERPSGSRILHFVVRDDLTRRPVRRLAVLAG